MGMYLFNEHPILANKDLARALGLNEAIVLQQLNYWIEMNKKTGKNFYDGKYWTYNSIRAWQENDFDYMSVDTVKRTFLKLEKMGYILIGKYNKDSRDKTKWYTINDKKLEELYISLNEKKKEIEAKVLSEELENTMPNALGQNAPMEGGKMHQCIRAKCTNALGQNAPMEGGKMHQPLPKTTTKTTTKTTNNLSPYNPPRDMTGGQGDDFKFVAPEECLQELQAQTEISETSELNSILKILADVLAIPDGVILYVNQTPMLAKYVKSRIRKLEIWDIEKIYEEISSGKDIKNMRGFIMTMAYNIVSNTEVEIISKASGVNLGGYRK